MKLCNKCGRRLPFTDFHKHANAPDGRQAYCKECRCEHQRQHRLDNLARDRARKREWYRQNREKLIARADAWRAANPEKVRDLYRRRRASEREGALVEKVERQRVFERDGGICGICCHPVDPDDWHMDHVVPLAAGGPHVYANVQVSHPFCNLSKGAKVPAAA